MRTYATPTCLSGAFSKLLALNSCCAFNFGPTASATFFIASKVSSTETFLVLAESPSDILGVNITRLISGINRHHLSISIYQNCGRLASRPQNFLDRATMRFLVYCRTLFSYQWIPAYAGMT